MADDNENIDYKQEGEADGKDNPTVVGQKQRDEAEEDDDSDWEPIIKRTRKGTADITSKKRRVLDEDDDDGDGDDDEAKEEMDVEENGDNNVVENNEMSKPRKMKAVVLGTYSDSEESYNDDYKDSDCSEEDDEDIANQRSTSKTRGDSDDDSDEKEFELDDNNDDNKSNEASNKETKMKRNTRKTMEKLTEILSPIQGRGADKVRLDSDGNLIEFEFSCDGGSFSSLMLEDLIETFPHIKILSLSNCMPFHRIPEEITEWTELESLKLNGCNNIMTIPSFICTMPNLRSLSITNCGVFDIPPEIVNLVNLTELDFSGFDFTIRYLPNGIFSKLRSLRKLNLSSDEKTPIPDEILELKNLTYLNVSGCTCEGTRSNFITNLETCDTLPFSLECLVIDNSELQSIDLECLWNFAAKCPSLTELSLAGNYIESLSPGLQKPTQLRKLDLSGNPVVRDPSQADIDVLLKALKTSTSLQQIRRPKPLGEEYEGSRLEQGEIQELLDMNYCRRIFSETKGFVERQNHTRRSIPATLKSWIIAKANADFYNYPVSRGANIVFELLRSPAFNDFSG